MTVSRRQLLKHVSALSAGAAVSPLLAPFVQRARAEANGENAPLRFVFVVKSSGLTAAELVPKEMFSEQVDVGEANNPGPNYRQALQLRVAEKLIDKPLVDQTLHESMASLEPFKDRLTIVQGLSGKMCRGGHSSWFGAMGCYRTGGEHDSGKIIGPTSMDCWPSNCRAYFRMSVFLRVDA